MATGNKTLTLRQFEKKYGDDFLELLEQYRSTNLWQRFLQLTAEEKADGQLRKVMRALDFALEVQWPFVHYKTAARYLHKDPEDIKATGGTNWQKYLPPHNQMIQLFPQLWSDQEVRDWGVKVTLEKSP